MVEWIRELINSETLHLYQPYIISLILGGLLGVEREFKKQREGTPTFGGIRTYTLISLLGTLTAQLAGVYGSSVLAVALASLAALLVVAQFFEKTPGLTSEVSALLTFSIGATCTLREFQTAAALSVAVLFILSAKEQMHEFVRHVTLEDLFAFLKFAAVTVIIYPLLPDKNFYGVNPREVWTMVVVISTIDFLGYVLTKLAGERGIVVTGLIGGLVSSTAVTATFSPLVRANPTLISEYGAGIVGASAIMFPRMAFLAGIVSLDFAKFLLIPSAIAFSLGIFSAYQLTKRKKSRAEVSVNNPYELSNAIKFGLFYAFILFLSRNSLKLFGDYGLYVVAAISGLSDVDAITLSVSKLFSSGEVSLISAIVAVLLSATVNTLFKWFLTLSMGGKELFRTTAPGFILLIAGEITGIGILWVVLR